MKKLKYLFLILVFVGSLGATSLFSYATYDQLAEYYAPVIYQEVYSNPEYAAFDRITSVDFDGDYDPTNNIQNAINDNGALPGAMYYFVIESATHFFIYYFPYHVWTNEGGLSPYSHEFDGIMVVVYKDGTEYGEFTALEIMSYGRVSVYGKYSGNDIESGNLNISGYLNFYTDNYQSAEHTGNHPVLFATYAYNGKGHSLRNWVDGIKTDTEMLLTYYYDPNNPNGETAPAAGNEQISNDDLGGNINNLHPVAYKLINITASNGIWTLQNNMCADGDTDYYFGYILGWNQQYCVRFKGATYNGTTLQGEELPWFFDDQGDGPTVLRGDWFFDPTRTFNSHVIVNQSYSFLYARHPFFQYNGMYLDEGAPSITSYPPRSVTLGDTYIYDVNAKGNGTLRYSLLLKPAGMTIDSSSGYIQWTPQSTGLYHVIVMVDNGASFMLQHFTVNVVAPPPPSHHSGGGGCEMADGSGTGILWGFILMLLLPFIYKLSYKRN